MDLKELLGDLYTDEIKEKIGEKRVFIFGEKDEIKLDAKEFVPKHRFNEVNDAKKELETQLAGLTKKIEQLKSSSEKGDELKQQVEQLNEEIKRVQGESEERLQRARKESAVKLALIRDGARDENLLATKIDFEKVSLDGENLIGYKEQLEKMKETYPWAFGKERVEGVPPNGNPNDDPNVKNPWSKEHFNLTEQARMIRDNPELAEKLRGSD